MVSASPEEPLKVRMIWRPERVIEQRQTRMVILFDIEHQGRNHPLFGESCRRKFEISPTAQNVGKCANKLVNLAHVLKRICGRRLGEEVVADDAIKLRKPIEIRCGV